MKEMVQEKELIRKAITPFEAGFLSDGIKLELGEIRGNMVTIVLRVAPDACSECMMPIPHLEKIFQKSISDEGFQNIQVRVTIMDEHNTNV